MDCLELIQDFETRHAKLGARKNSDNPELWDQQHAELQRDFGQALSQRYAELKNIKTPLVDNLIEIKNIEYLMPELLPDPPPGPLEQKVTAMNAELIELKAKVDSISLK